MIILVLGGSGFLVSHVCDQLSEAGHKVRILTVSSLGFRHDQEMIVGDLLDEKTLAKAISGCEVVYNFAAIADLNEALNKPIETARINVLGYVMLLEVCRQDVQCFVWKPKLQIASRQRCAMQIYYLI